MKPRKLLLILNPRAGKNKSRGPLFDAAAALSQAGYLLSIHVTSALSLIHISEPTRPY